MSSRGWNISNHKYASHFAQERDDWDINMNIFAEKLAKRRHARKPVYVRASFSAAQGRPGGPRGRPAPPLPLGAAPLGNLAKRW